jgi:trehalose synthase
VTEPGLQTVPTDTRPLAAYAPYMEPALRERVDALARQLRGLRLVHVNATAAGGGVAEILQSLVPLTKSLGIAAEWLVLPPNDDFFAVTKRIHNWLQGAPGRPTPDQERTYLGYLEVIAAGMRGLQADVWVIHDPQPLPLRALVPLAGGTIWRCHIDASEPNPYVRDWLLPFVRGYDRLVFSMRDYVPGGLASDRLAIEQPAIDPLTPKNRRLPRRRGLDILRGLGLDPARPLVSQVSRFDPWKNPRQAVDAYRLAKRELPDLQLALVGVFSAKDDPEGPKVYADIRDYTAGDPDVHLYTDPARVGDPEVNAFQSRSNVILQRSLREGFGLTVTEAMWKATPVVATPVGGIVVQIEDGVNGFLTRTTEGCAELVVRLVRDPALAHRIGHAARASVRRRFLLPRLLADELALYAAVAGARGAIEAA